MLFSVFSQLRVMPRKQQFFFLSKMFSGTDSHFVKEIVKPFMTLGAPVLQAFRGFCT